MPDQTESNPWKRTTLLLVFIIVVMAISLTMSFQEAHQAKNYAGDLENEINGLKAENSRLRKTFEISIGPVRNETIELLAKKYVNTTMKARFPHVYWKLSEPYQTCFMECDQRDGSCMYYCQVFGKGSLEANATESKDFILMFYCNPVTTACGLYQNIFMGESEIS